MGAAGCVRWQNSSDSGLRDNTLPQRERIRARPGGSPPTSALRVNLQANCPGDGTRVDAGDPVRSALTYHKQEAAPVKCQYVRRWSSKGLLPTELIALIIF